tara:strand:- start:40 stop:813 length:774 start_codon:yes stop_codon:yes gene_type:complete
MIKSFSLLTFFLITTFGSLSQIINSNVTPETKEVKVDSIKDVTIDSLLINSITNYEKSTIYITAGYVNSFRYFTDESIYQSLGKKYDETPISTYSIGVGTYIPLTNHLDLEIGVSYVLQGEQYLFSDSLTDSTFHYVNKYKHFGLPIRLRYSIGNGNFKGLVYGGVIPSNILSIRYESDYTNVDGNEVLNNVETKKNDLASFNLTASIGFGFTYQKNDIGFILIPEYRYNLLNTFSGYPVKHNLWSWGVNSGLVINF